MRHSGKAVIIDASSSGASGDKFLGALIDLGGNPKSLQKIAGIVEKNLPGVTRVQIDTKTVERGEIRCKLVSVSSQETVSHRKASLVHTSAKRCATALGLSEWATSLVSSIFETLSSAESRVHGSTTKDVELHELGSADTLVDVLGVAYLVDEIGLSRANWWCSPVAVGTGISRFSERDYPNPAPAVSEILSSHKIPMRISDVQFELTTPTGAAITANLVKGDWGNPTVAPSKIGYGAGSKDLDQVANILRLTVGEKSENAHSHDEVVVLETNLDDVSGEVIGHAVESLMAAGARDVSITPIFMKKNRPGQLISIISDKTKSEQLAELLMKETGTLGVREMPVSRHISGRKTYTVTVNVKEKKYQIRVKAPVAKGRLIRGGKLEYEDLRRISNETGLSIREVQNIASNSIDRDEK